MSLDFFANRCQHHNINAEEFGLCDPENGTKAYVDFTNSNDWIAKVKNSNHHSFTFTAIDKCVITDSELQGIQRCDAMLHSSEHLYLIELKDQNKDWVQGAINQLESTVELLIANHEDRLKSFRIKKAFACNKQKRIFQSIDNEKQKRFYHKYKFRLDIQANIVIV